MNLIRRWDSDELAGKEVIPPAPAYQWNQLGELCRGFYENYQGKTLLELRKVFVTAVTSLVQWLNGFSGVQVGGFLLCKLADLEMGAYQYRCAIQVFSQ